jgi:plasmid stabilization system protein ParE
MRLIIHPRVRRDVRGILDWYDARSDQAGDRFHAELMDALDSVKKFSGGHPFIGPLHRRYTFKHFPYHLVFDVVVNVVQVLALLHHKRHPHFGLKRKW